MAVVDRHIAAMSTRDVETIAADYSEDTVIITTLAPEPLIGKAAMKAFLATLLAAGAAEVDAAASPTFIRKEAVGEYVYLAFDLGNGRTATETYHVRNDLVVFETATF
ncbi:nuclear transport factor 2 family protein [Nocardia neocaledoniensis]|uniref:SnoaL-like protein n=1 Tax=Nocardia neocaledoniensis TaxID=236511 RepID=A0A317N2X2_9NOCA|nr:nuclear transport factor 2 family protein [Nocardia neocaledoniensis]PWV68945.1 SnoaL-like protein [Nocardia neocaledoniensis]